MITEKRSFMTKKREREFAPSNQKVSLLCSSLYDEQAREMLTS